MTTVLLESRREGITGWIGVRRSRMIVIKGMSEGDMLQVYLNNDKDCIFIARANADFPLPEGTLRIKVQHVLCSGSRVSVDLV